MAKNRIEVDHDETDNETQLADLAVALQGYQEAFKVAFAPLADAHRKFAIEALEPLRKVRLSGLTDLHEQMSAVGKQWAEAIQPDTSWVHDAIRVSTGLEDAMKAVATSVRLPGGLHDVASRAVDLGLANSMTDLVASGLRTNLGLLAMTAIDQHDIDDVRAALAEHYEEHPDAQPSMAMIVEAAAQLEDHPAADHPELVEAAIADLGDDAYVEDVLAWVKGALSSVAS